MLFIRMITDDDIRWLLEILPVELVRYIIASYNPLCFFIMDDKWLLNYDWSLQCKATFGLDGKRTLYEYFNMCNRFSKWLPHNVKLYTCGGNDYGQLGLGVAWTIGTFCQIMGLPTDIIQVAVGKYHTIILLSSGALMGCGANDYGQLGLGDLQDRYTFEIIPNVPNDVVLVSCGFDYTYIMRKNGMIMACGANGYGQLGIDRTRHKTVFAEVPNLPNDITHIVCGYYHTIIMTADGTLMCCGKNDFVQLGLGTRTDQEKFQVITDMCSPVGDIVSMPKDIVQITSGEYHSLVLTAGGKLMGCGRSHLGQLSIFDKSVPLFKEIAYNVEQVASTTSTTFIRKTDGTIMGCGDNSSGQLGLEKSKLCVEPFTKIKMDANIAKISCSTMYTVVLTTDNILMCSGVMGRLGSRNQFKVISDLPKNIIQIDAGERHMLIIASG